MKVEDPEQALTQAVCSRVREQLDGVDAELAEAFARQFYRWVAPEDVADRDPMDLYGLAFGTFNFARERPPGETKVRVYNPRFEEHGWQSTHTAVEIVTDDMPFLIDSVTMELNRRGYGVHLIIHPVVRVIRDSENHLTTVMPPTTHTGHGEFSESVIHVEVDRQTDKDELEALKGHLLRVIGEVRAAVEDWPAMRRRAIEIAHELTEATDLPMESEEIAETRSFLAWLADHNFTFLGYREYDVCPSEDGKSHRLDCVKGSGLGILRHDERASGSRPFDEIPPAARARALEPYLLNP